MSSILPKGFTQAQFEKVLAQLSAIVGSDNVHTTELHTAAYKDPYSLDDERFLPSAAVSPINNEEIKKILKLANETQLPLWVVSAGKNYCYGGAAPSINGTVVLDLKRMKKIEVNEKLGYAVVEPGVSYFDLYEHLQRNGSELWLDCAAPGWGSVMGNSLDYGVGYTPYADHAGQQCGMEVILPDGETIRTGMGGMEGTSVWNVFKHSFGPSLDGLFKQSNLGVVTKMGIWLMRAPELFMGCRVSVQRPEDIVPLIEITRDLRLRGHMQGSPTAGNWMRTLCGRTTQREWWDGEGAIPPHIIEKMIAHFKIGHWNMNFGLYGGEEVTLLHYKVIEEAMRKIPGLQITAKYYRKGETIGGADRLMAGIPHLLAFNSLNWLGGHGAHIEYCPVMPMDGEIFYKRYQKTLAISNEYGFDCFSGMLSTTERAAINTGQIIFDKSNKAQVKRVDEMFKALIQSTIEDKLPIYRTHLAHMDAVAKTFDFEGGSTMRTYQKLKRALDPQGILSQGKSGIHTL